MADEGVRIFLDTNSLPKDSEGNPVFIEGAGRIFKWNESQIDFFMKNPSIKNDFVELVPTEEEVKKKKK